MLLQPVVWFLAISRAVHASSDDQVFCHSEADGTIYTPGDYDDGGRGIWIANYDDQLHGNLNGSMYIVYESDMETVPYKYIIIPPWESAFITVCPTFEGRVVRGDYGNFDGMPHLLGTWVEVNWHEDGSSWGDISLLEGNDGGAVIQSLDGLDNTRGFSIDLITNAPDGSWAYKTSGAACLDKVVGDNANLIAKAWQMEYLDPWNVYLDNEINPVIASQNSRFQVTFYPGFV